MTRYFDLYEKPIATLADLETRIRQIDALGKLTGLKFYWRGQSNASWGVHSSLHRAIATNASRPPTSIDLVMEATVVRHEEAIVEEARPWIRPSVDTRLTTVDLFARLQHSGVPTRLIDFTSDPLVALFFAVADGPDVDGRLVVAAARGVTNKKTSDAFDIPWKSGRPTRPKDWDQQLYALEDQAHFLRINRQKGVFVIAGTPSTKPHKRYPDGKSLTAVEVRLSTSIPLALHQWSRAEAALMQTKTKGRAATTASALTLRIPRESKAKLLEELEARELSWSYLFPDAEGLRLRGPVASRLTGS